MSPKNQQDEIKSILEYSRHTIGFLEIMDWEIPSKIFLYLRTHGELSLKQLAASIGKSKTTISRHIVPMLERKLIDGREYKKAHYYQLDTGLLRFATPLDNFTSGNPDKKILFERLLDQMDHEELLLVNRATDALQKIILKILRNTITQVIEYIELYEHMPVNKQRLMEYEKHMDLILTFTSLNQANIGIFNKHWDVFSKNYNKDIKSNVAERDDKLDPFPNETPIAADALAWLFKMPLNKIFKIK